MIELSQEREIVRAMIRLYCRKNHTPDPLCEECSQLWFYVDERLEKCPYGFEKPTCQNCTVHCYKPEMRQRIKEIMRYSGPSMIWHHPVMAIRHLIHNRRS